MSLLFKPYIFSCAPGFLLSIIAITLNIFVIKFYWKIDAGVVPLLYKSIASLDILSAIGFIYMYVVFLLLNKDLIDFRTADINAMIFFFITQVSCRCSVFSNLVLAVSRTLMLLKPFYQINMNAVKLACILFAVPWIVFNGINLHEFYWSYIILLSDNGLLIGSGLAFVIYQIKESSNTEFRVVSMLPDVLAFVVPVIFVIIACAIQVISLRRLSQFPASSNQRHVTITVLLMSALFVLCNSPFCATIVERLVFISTGDRDNTNVNAEWSYLIIVTTATVLPILNAALNPVIIITRSGEMRRKFKDSLQSMLRAIRGRRE